MELGDFVRDALVQIVQGISEAQTATAETGARVAPQTVAYFKQLTAEIILDNSTHRPLHIVEFDIAVSATQESGRAGKIGVLAASLGAGVEGHTGHQTERVSRVRFSVPIAFPHAS